jgi:hypothetical protein
MTPLRWTREAPKEAGWYWQRQRGYTGGFVVYVEQSVGGPRYYANDAVRSSYPGLPIVDIEWAGPIAPPEEPRSGDSEAAEEEA